MQLNKSFPEETTHKPWMIQIKVHDNIHVHTYGPHKNIYAQILTGKVIE